MLLKEIGRDGVEARYGNLFEMYERITGESPYETPMRIYPAPHYTMGGLWVDYNLQTNSRSLRYWRGPTLSDHGSNRLGASALMQGLADGYFVLPYTIGHYLAQVDPSVKTDNAAFEESKKFVNERFEKLLAVKGKNPVMNHRELGLLMLDKVGMSRDKEGLEHTIREIKRIRKRILDEKE